MKNNIYKIFLTLFLVATGLVFTACETTDLDLQDNPNVLTPGSADPAFILNAIQLNIVNQHITLSILTEGIMRQNNMFGTYAANAGTGTMNGPWANAYQIMNNLNLLEDISSSQNLPNHVGMGQILEAFAFINLVDYIGVAAFSEAVNTDFPNPNLDQGNTIYDAMYAQLDAAIVNMQATQTVAPEDLYYQGDKSKWIKLANTLKLKMYLQSKLTNNAAAAGQINAIVASGNYISSSNDDFIARFNKNETNPDARHPYFQQNYQFSANQYMSNSFMDMLLHGKSIKDPRMNYYFYRQVLYDPNDPAVSGLNLLPCDGSAAHGSLCYIGDGYWGRKHADDEGIPNDGDKRTAYGIYPGGGAYDAAGTQAEEIAIATATYDAGSGMTLNEWIFKRLSEVNPATNASTNLGGAGIHPMLLSSFSAFMLAEASLPAPAGMGVTGDSKALLESGMRQSFAKVASVAEIAMDASKVDQYVSEVLAEYDAAANDQARLAIIIREYYIASFGNAIEPYNNYRRTGYPTLDAGLSPGDFPRSFFIPSSEINTNDNPNLTQKLLTDQVFWDTNPAGFIN